MILRIPDNAPRIIVPFHFEGFAVCWAGSGRRAGEFCFGGEDGTLRLTTVVGAPTLETTSSDVDSEAVNGVAFSGSLMAISTRQQVAFWTLPQGDDLQSRPAILPCGSHGVVTTEAGDFIAPLGPIGLMKARAEQSHVAAKRISADGQTLDFYKVVGLSGDAHEVLACAIRSGGVAAIELDADGAQRSLKTTTFAGLDVVDVCPLGEHAPLALVALGRDGALALFRDVLHDRAPATVKFIDLQGAAYRVFIAHGSVFILTSAGLYILDGLAQRFLLGEPIGRLPTSGRLIPLEAVDANLCGDQWLLVVMPDDVIAINLTALRIEPAEADAVAEERSIQPTLLRPPWQSRENDVSEIELPLAG